MFKFTVRPAGIADFTAIYKLNSLILGSKLETEAAERVYRNILSDPEQILFAVIHSGNVIGYTHVRQVNNLFEERYSEIVSIAIYDYYLDKNADSELLGAAGKWSEQMLSNKIIFSRNAGKSVSSSSLLKNGFGEYALEGYEKILL